VLLIADPKRKTGKTGSENATGSKELTPKPASATYLPADSAIFNSLDRLSHKCDNKGVYYEIETTNVFDKWLARITDIRHRARIAIRFDQIRTGNFGDHKNLGGGLFELRFFLGPGFRAYYTVRNGRVVLLLTGGDKSTQAKDIKKAHNIMTALEE
jgi:putative addiction module killer protein